MPAEALVIIVLVAVVPWVVMSFTFTCLVMWRDWRQSETKKGESPLRGPAVFDSGSDYGAHDLVRVRDNWLTATAS